jgi:glycosyltransferase involved in cell wall biosynthesis
MPPPIVYDGFRLLLGALTHTPRGIDRVDLLYARFLFEHWPGACFGLLPTPWGSRLYDRDRTLRMLASVQASWREEQAPGRDPAYDRLGEWLRGVPVQAQPVSRSRRSGTLRRGLGFLRDNGVTLGQPAIGCAPKNAIYLNVGQMGWATPMTTRWLRSRPDIPAIYMLHDIIPLQYPKLVSKGGRLSHRWMLRSVLRNAAGLITTSSCASATIMARLRQQGLPTIPLRAIPLPVADVFLARDPREDDPDTHPYFVICGAIEPRKNHLLLLKVWHRLVQRIGASAPRLVVVGSPAYQGDRIVRRFQEAAELRDHVIVVSGLASPSLRQLMVNARAVLMPSLAEGFGLPVIEALAVGTPVLASDLAVHREVGQDFVNYLDPADDVAWFDAILKILGDSSATASMRQRVSRYRPLTPGAYFRSVSEFLTGFA